MTVRNYLHPLCDVEYNQSHPIRTYITENNPCAITLTYTEEEYHNLLGGLIEYTRGKGHTQLCANGIRSSYNNKHKTHLTIVKKEKPREYININDLNAF
jgi:hypothetical protein